MPAVCLEMHATEGLGISLGALKMNTKIEALDLDNAVNFCVEWLGGLFRSWRKALGRLPPGGRSSQIGRDTGLSNLQVITQLLLLVITSSSDDKNRSECTIEVYNFLSRQHPSFGSPSRSLWVIFVAFDLLFIENNRLFWLAPSCFFGPFTRPLI